MTSGSQSKAQRRQESQQRAAERRAAERRAKRNRTALRFGLPVAVVAVIVVIVVVATGGGGGVPPSQKNPHVKVNAIPASFQMTPAAATKPGYEGIAQPVGSPLATLANAATGQTVDGVQCQTNEQLVTHVHSHLTIFVNGKAKVIPYGIGIPGFQAQPTADGPFVTTGSCFYWLHTHANDGVIHIESPSTSETFTLGQFFAEWGIPLSKTQVGPAKGKVTVFFTAPGQKSGIYTGNPANLPLGDHYQIQLDVGTPIIEPVQVTKWGSL
ncbi:MAG TPA: hypothetical protein VG298_16710 [Acidimicrobiales bacterium]|jgi:hypothetical protein|nr:hypothetical protein [Acidimicrobiales bacterium]